MPIANASRPPHSYSRRRFAAVPPNHDAPIERGPAAWWAKRLDVSIIWRKNKKKEINKLNKINR